MRRFVVPALRGVWCASFFVLTPLPWFAAAAQQRPAAAPILARSQASSAPKVDPAATTTEATREPSTAPQPPHPDTKRQTQQQRDAEPAASQVPSSVLLDYATFLVALVTGVVALFLTAFGILWIRFGNLRRELTTQRRAIKKERLLVQAQIETFKAEIETQERRLAMKQRFDDAVLYNYSSLFVGIVERFGSVLKPAEARKLSALIFEAEAALDLFHPEQQEVLKALLRLEQVGADGSVPSIVRLRDDPAAPGDIRVRAEQVLGKIRERIRRDALHSPRH